LTGEAGQRAAHNDQCIDGRERRRDSRVWRNTIRTEERNMTTRAHNALTGIDTRLRELAHRSNSGVDVTLSWHAGNDELLVCVYDERRGAYFEISPERDLALDVYYHPYAYVGQSDGRLAA
jgi:hypothetical protein